MLRTVVTSNSLTVTNFEAVSCSKDQWERADETFVTYLKAAEKRSSDDRRLRANDQMVKLELVILTSEAEVTELSSQYRFQEKPVRMRRHLEESLVQSIKLRGEVQRAKMGRFC